jgi:hypothetical protein
MASTKNSQNPYNFKTIDDLKFIQNNYFTTATNTTNSVFKKLEIIQLICFITQKLHKKDAETYRDAVTVLEKIFNIDLRSDVNTTNGNTDILRSFGLLCDDLMWNTNDEFPTPEGCSNIKDIKNKIVTYFNDEWMPF